MYKKFFGLAKNPFNMSPDPGCLFYTAQLREAISCLTYGIQARKGFILLTGEVGTGKTTLLNKLLGWLHKEKMPTAFVFNSRLNSRQLLDFILTDFGIPCDSRMKSQVLLRLNYWLLERHHAGETPVLIIDEAQNLSDKALEEIRLLTNLETATEKLMQIVLSGQPELEHKLHQPQLRQLQQRIALRCKTSPLSREETHAYIAERLRLCGANGAPIFSPDATDQIFACSQGIPRVINLLCEFSLINAFVEGLRPVPVRVVEEVAREFDLLEAKPAAQTGVAGNEPIEEAFLDWGASLAEKRRASTEPGGQKEPNTSSEKES